MTSTPADRLRAAATRLRTLADAAERSLGTAPYWRSERVACGTLDPAFGRAVADWLQSAAEDAEQVGPDHRALAVADQLLNTPGVPCGGFPDTCPNLRDVPPAPPRHGGGVRCGCSDTAQPREDS